MEKSIEKLYDRLDRRLLVEELRLCRLNKVEMREIQLMVGAIYKHGIGSKKVDAHEAKSSEIHEKFMITSRSIENLRHRLKVLYKFFEKEFVCFPVI